MLYTLLDAYRELERRVGETAAPRGEKSELVRAAIAQGPATFSVADLQRACPGVSVDLIRRVLKNLKEAGEVECTARGRNAVWRRMET